jgi:hypothetical protein
MVFCTAGVVNICEICALDMDAATLRLLALAELVGLFYSIYPTLIIRTTKNTPFTSVIPNHPIVSVSSTPTESIQLKHGPLG